MTSRDFPQVRLHIVTGKGGTGKSTVAAALALGLASAGTNVLLCEVEGRQGIARMFDVEPLPYAERRIATGLPEPDGGRGGVLEALAALLAIEIHGGDAARRSGPPCKLASRKRMTIRRRR